MAQQESGKRAGAKAQFLNVFSTADVVPSLLSDASVVFLALLLRPSVACTNSDTLARPLPSPAVPASISHNASSWE